MIFASDISESMPPNVEALIVSAGLYTNFVRIYTVAHKHKPVRGGRCSRKLREVCTTESGSGTNTQVLAKGDVLEDDAPARTFPDYPDHDRRRRRGVHDSKQLGVVGISEIDRRGAVTSGGTATTF